MAVSYTHLARQFKAKSEGPAVKVQGLDLEDAPAKLVNGHMFQPTGLTALRDVGAEAGKVTVLSLIHIYKNSCRSVSGSLDAW